MTIRLHTALHHRHRDPLQVAAHRHQQHELVLIVRGSLTVDATTAILPGGSGDLHIFPAGLVHDQRCRGPWHTICVLFQGEDDLVSAGPVGLDLAGDPLLPSWFEQLCTLARSQDPDDGAAGDALLIAAVHRLHRIRRDGRERAGRPAALVEALKRIEAQLACDLDVAALARGVGCSQSHLGDLFRRHVGCSAKRHHTRMRLKWAKSLLANPYTSVSTVARTLGFTDLNWFVRRFRAEHGVPPGRWHRAQSGTVTGAP